ncbi:MAG TPA: hypothetical protein VM911_14030 [Pyrinomonadaceae bacterium]|jgi:hypothetical protein|nr:hypothetical protein [Pyrinomonadaceae bacterium]
MSNERCVEYSGFSDASTTIYWRKRGFIGRFEDFLHQSDFSNFAGPKYDRPPIIID